LIRTGHTLGWNSGDRIVSISGATTASYLYDYQGRRSSKTVGSATIYLYDGLNLIREAGASSADYLFGPGIDEPLAMSRGGQVYYYETDSLGSINALTDSSATVQNAYLYDAWGQVKSQTGSLTNPFTYTSREAGEAGLNFYRARYYNSGVGRFLSEDLLPLLEQDVDGPYAYALNDPVSISDPLGLYGTTGCSYYTQRCRDARDCKKYYCETAPPVCNSPRLRGRVFNCVRQCLQDYDQGKDCGGTKPCSPPYPPVHWPSPWCNECIRDAHTFCFWHCTRSPDKPPILPKRAAAQ